MMVVSSTLLQHEERRRHDWSTVPFSKDTTSSVYTVPVIGQDYQNNLAKYRRIYHD